MSFYLHDRDNVNVYWVLNEIFRFALKDENDFASFANPKRGGSSQPSAAAAAAAAVRIRCEVCGDVCRRAVEYCGVFACAKCRLFFQVVMTQRTLFSLRCGKNNDCQIRGANKSRVSHCKRCRADKCRQLGMLDQYYLQEMVVSPKPRA